MCWSASAYAIVELAPLPAAPGGAVDLGALGEGGLGGCTGLVGARVRQEPVVERCPAVNQACMCPDVIVDIRIMAGTAGLKLRRGEGVASHRDCHGGGSLLHFRATRRNGARLSSSRSVRILVPWWEIFGHTAAVTADSVQPPVTLRLPGSGSVGGKLDAAVDGWYTQSARPHAPARKCGHPRQVGGSGAGPACRWIGFLELQQVILHLGLHRIRRALHPGAGLDRFPRSHTRLQGMKHRGDGAGCPPGDLLLSGLVPHLAFVCSLRTFTFAAPHPQPTQTHSRGQWGAGGWRKCDRRPSGSGRSGGRGPCGPCLLPAWSTNFLSGGGDRAVSVTRREERSLWGCVSQ